MMDKYYTPELEEFHAGFECETSVSHKERRWIPTIFTNDEIGEDSQGRLRFLLTDLLGLRMSEFRVKYLDEEDVLSLGFKESHEESSFGEKYFTFESKDGINHFSNYHLRLLQTNVSIRVKKEYGYHNSSEQIFDGYVKNKSEFKKLLKQLRVKL